MDTTSDHGEEETPRCTGGVCDDGKPLSGEAPSFCKTADLQDYSHQRIPRVDGDNQTLDNSVSREDGVEDRVDGSMEVEGN